ncbi:MAG: sigma-70 family RNA polymerase sigma factor [Acidobacteriota bacterium]
MTQGRKLNMSEEQELLNSFMDGDRKAAEDLVNRTYKSIYTFLYRLCRDDENLALDLTQETYQKAWKALREFDGRSKFSTWLYRIAYNTFLNYARHPLRVVSIDDKARSAPICLDEGQEARMMEHEMKENLRQAVLNLPDELRFAITARYWGELSVQDIARMEQVSVVAVRRRMRRALKSIARYCEGRR